MAKNIPCVLAKCVFKKAFWSCLVILFTAGVLLYQHSFQACAGMMASMTITLFALYEEYNDPE